MLGLEWYYFELVKYPQSTGEACIEAKILAFKTRSVITSKFDELKKSNAEAIHSCMTQGILSCTVKKAL